MTTIEPHGKQFVVYHHGTFPQSSVLAGQASRTFLYAFDTLAEARVAYPSSAVLEHGTKRWEPEDASLADLSGLSPVPPPWFDERAAGERWDPED